MRRNLYAQVAVLVALPVVVHAQEFRATVKGRVVDPTNAAVPGCTVQVRNTGTNVTSNRTTDSTGSYNVPFLQPGRYSITFEAPGFKKLTRSDLTLQIDQTAVIDAKLEVGAVSDEVTVTAAVELLEMGKADRGQVVDSKQILELPMNGRNPYLLATLAPGATSNGEARFLRPFDLPNAWKINGGLNGNNEFLLDGAPNNAQAGRNNVGLVPPVDAVQEFKVQTSSYDAQYGKTSGGIINVSLKSGTNELHGSLYEFTRQKALDANTFALNAQQKARPNHYLYETGATLGGPVVLPGLYDGRNKTFFFLTYEDWREQTPETGYSSLPTLEMIDQPDAAKCGGVPHCADFSNLYRYNADGTRTLIQIYDPLSDPTNRTPFPGNIIPANRISPIARRILSYFPAPNYLDNPNASFYSNNDFFRSSLDKDRFYNWAFKLDHSMGDGRHHVFVSGGHNKRNEYRQFNPVPMGQPGENAQNPLERVNSVVTADWVTSFSSTFVGNLRVGWNYNAEGWHDLPNESFDLSSLGFPASMVNQLALKTVFGDYNFSDYSSLGRLGSNVYTTTISVHPSISKLFGSHAFKAGLDLRRIAFDQQQPGEHDVFRLNASRSFTRRVWNSDDTAANGNSIASFLLGYPSDGTAAVRTLPTTVQYYVAPYLQDDWKVSQRLTLNLGVRLDLNVAPVEEQNRINRGFDTTVINPTDALISHTVADPRGGTFTVPQLRGGLLFAGVDGRPTRVSGLDTTTIQPRVGFTYEVTKKAVVRGGYGRYYLNPSNDYLQYAGFSAITNLVSSLDGGRTPDVTTIGGPLISNPFPLGINQPTGSSLGPRTFLGQGFSYFAPDFEVPHIDQFSLGVQLALGSRSRVDLSYVGSRGSELQSSKPINEPSLELRQKCNPMEGGDPSYCADKLPNPFYQLPEFKNTSLYNNATLSRWELSRPFPQFGSITELGRNDNKTWYDSLQVSYQVRAGQSLNLSVGYTFSKNMELSGWLDVQKGVQNRSLTDDDQPHTFKLASVWTLPFGKERRFLNHASGFLGALVSGWEHTMLIGYVSGRPQGLPGGSVQYLRDATISDVDWSQSIVQGWLPCVALRSQNPPYTLSKGQSWNDSLCGTDLTQAQFLDLNLPGDAHAPRYTNFRDGQLRLQSAPSIDMSLNKTTQITGRAQLQFRVEAFNLLNTFRYFRQGFNTNTRDKNFGNLIKANIGDGSNVGYPRQIQLGLKLLF